MDPLCSLPASRTFRDHRSNISRARFGVAALLCQLILPTAFVVLAVIPVDFLDSLPNVCIYKGLFGVRCLGCGMTHAFCSVLHGHIAAAFQYNHLVTVAFPFFAVAATRNLASAASMLRELALRR